MLTSSSRMLSKRSALATALMLAFGSNGYAATLQVNDFTDVDTTSNDNLMNLREAISLAEADTANDIITFDTTTSQSITLNSPITVSASSAGSGTITIDGGNNIELVRDMATSGSGSATIFSVSGRNEFNLQNLIIDTDGAANYGNFIEFLGATSTTQNHTLDNATLRNTAGSPYVRGIFASNINGNITISNSSVSGMRSNSFDHTYGGTAVFLSSNKTAGLNIQNSTVSDNVSGGLSVYGGAIMIRTDETNNMYSSTLSISSSTFDSNTSSRANTTGGAVSVITSNLNAPSISISDSTFSNNGDSNTNFGGAVGIVTSNVPNMGISISNSTFSNNTSDVSGGAVGIVDNGADETSNLSISIANSSFSENTGGYGGGVSIDTGAQPSNVLLSGNTFNNNTASSRGGGLFLKTYPAQVTALVANSTFTGNTSNGNGGGIYAYSDDSLNLTIANSTIVQNTANSDGGGLALEEHYDDLVVNIVNSVIANNTAESDNDILDLGDADTPSTIINSFLGTDLQSEVGTLGFDTVVNNQFGNDPGLGSLGDNDGPTQTMLPNSDSPLVDAGSNGNLTFGTVTLTSDQRNFLRVADGTVDIGAVETNSRPNIFSSGSASAGVAWLMGMTFLLPFMRRRQKQS